MGLERPDMPRIRVGSAGALRESSDLTLTNELFTLLTSGEKQGDQISVSHVRERERGDGDYLGGAKALFAHHAELNGV
jgi:hypothetical protein